MVYLRWQLKHTSGWIEAPGYSRTCLFSFGPPPRLKGIMRLFILETSVCSHKLLWALAQLTKLCELLQWQTSRCRGCRWYGLPDRKVLALLKDYVSVIRLLKHHVVRETKRRRSSLVGKSAQTSAECNKLIMVTVSPVMDILSIQYLDYHVNLNMLLKINFVGLCLMMMLNCD